MRVYKLILLIALILFYSCGGSGGGGGNHPSSSSGGGTTDGGSGTGDGGTVVTSGSIEFTSATPQVIGIQGSGQTETSDIIFTVKDSNGDPISGLTVSFTMIGPNGGEYITPSSATTSSSGTASTRLNSGSVSGPVSITASVDIGSTTVTSSPAAISIGGGVPSATHLNLAASRKNLAGLVYSGLESTISVYIADRFGNYNVLEGTSVSFYTEAGAIDRSNTLDETGQTSVTLRTQSPIPADVIMSSSESTDLASLNTTYSLGIGGEPYSSTQTHPRDGWVTVLATVQGEEAFDDANANGVYDSGEDFTDIGEPFYDKNDDGCRNTGTQKTCYDSVTETTSTSASTDPFEEYIDEDSDGSYDAPNGFWDGPNCPDAGCKTSKMIWTDLTMQFTGNATTCAIDPPLSGNAVADGGSRTFRFMVSDLNYNTPVSGTEITAKLTGGGQLLGATSFTIPDGVSSGPYEVSVMFTDETIGDTSAAEFYSIEFEVTSDEVVTCVSQVATGTVD